MPIRRLNFTGRKRIRQVDAEIDLRESDGRRGFSANLHLQDYDFPPDALVFVEAYRQTSWMRFHFGTVADLGPRDALHLTEFGSPEGVLFRVRVTSAHSPRGLLLGEADKIRPRRADPSEEDRFPLLPARPDESLDAEIFRVDFDDHPILLINRKVGDWQGLTQNPTFQALALPSVLRQILIRVLHIDRSAALDDPDDWRCLWLRFASRLPGVTDPPKVDEVDQFDDWIDDAVESFARKFQTMERFQRYWTSESDG